MQAQGAARGGVGTAIPRRGGGGGGRLGALLTVAAVPVIVALMMRGVLAPATGGVEAQDGRAGVGASVVHDDAGNVR